MSSSPVARRPLWRSRVVQLILGLCVSAACLWWAARGLINDAEARQQFVEAVKRQGIDQKSLSIPGDGHPSIIKHKILGDTMTPYFLDVVK